MLIPEGLIVETLKAVTVKLISSYVKKDKKKYVDLDKLILRYLFGVYNWSDSLQFLGMERPHNIDSETVNLSYSSIPRRFVGQSSISKKIFTEYEVFENSNNYIILGNPGSGKTTTIKRFIRILINEEPLNNSDIYYTPIVIKLKDIKEFVNIHLLIAEIIGFPVYNKEKTTITKIYDEDPQQFILEFLDNSKTILFLDGLDEVANEYKDDLYNQIEELSFKLRASKIVLTCRSGDYYRNIQGFNTLEILPLSKEQIIEISKIWLNDTSAFFAEIIKYPYRDVIDRPLLLSHLLFLYSKSGHLPEQPSLVYKKLIKLLLEDWDQQRGIKRKTKYSLFDADKKLEFLSALSFQLTYINKISTFSSDTLITSYYKICNKFRLPIDEAEEVITEIESHNGIVVKVGTNYEFSHLSLQEYLAGNYIVRSPHTTPLLQEYINVYPAPISVAIAMSSEPSKLFACLFLNENLIKKFTPNSINSFVDRLLLEAPLFDIDPELGCAIMNLFNVLWNNKLEENRDLINKLFSIENIKKSLICAIRQFKIINPKNKDYLYIEPWWDDRSKYNANIFFEKRLLLPKKFFLSLFDGQMPMLNITNE